MHLTYCSVKWMLEINASKQRIRSVPSQGKQTAPVDDCTERGAALAVALTITLHAPSQKLCLWTSHAKLELYAKPAAAASSGSPGGNKSIFWEGGGCRPVECD